GRKLRSSPAPRNVSGAEGVTQMTGDEREKLAIRTYLINNFVSGHDLSVQPKFAERTRLRSRAERLSSRVKALNTAYFLSAVPRLCWSQSGRVSASGNSLASRGPSADVSVAKSAQLPVLERSALKAESWAARNSAPQGAKLL